MKTIRAGEVSWSFLGDGKAARSDVVERLIRDGVVSPRNDGLFPDDSQTFGAAP